MPTDDPVRDAPPAVPTRLPLSRWARRPILSVLALTLLTLVALIAGDVLGAVVVEVAGGDATGDLRRVLGRLIAAGLLIALVMALRAARLVGLSGPAPRGAPSPANWAYLALVPGALVVLVERARPKSAAALWAGIGDNMLVGVVEEIGFRGLVLTVLLLAWGATTRGIVQACVVSSLAFGLLHLVVGVLGGGDPGFLVAQLVYSSCIGMLFAGVVARTRALWTVILAHGILDTALNTFAGDDPGLGLLTVATLLTLPLAAAGYRLATTTPTPARP